MSLSVTKFEPNRLQAESTPSSDPMLREAESLLEFDRVRELLAQEARFYMSREIVRESRPSRHPEDVARLQDETAEAVTLLKGKGDIGLAGMRDPRDPLRRAMLGGALNGSELLMLCSIFQSMWIARSTVMMIEDDAPSVVGYGLSNQRSARSPDQHRRSALRFWGCARQCDAASSSDA